MLQRTMVGLLIATLVGGCYSSGGETGEGGTDDAGRYDDSGDDGFRDDAPDVEEECDGIVCYVDFPCMMTSYCANDTRVQPCRTVWCEEACGTRCCSGGTCRDGTPFDCPGETVCWEIHQPGYAPAEPLRTAECRPRPTEPPADGGADVDEDDGGADGGPYDVWLPPGAYRPTSYCQ